MNEKELGKKRQRHSREQWQSMISQYAASGLGIERYCEREGISKSSFCRWRRLLSTEESRRSDLSGQSNGNAGFVDAGLLRLGGRGRLEIRLELGEGIVLYLARG
jgi:transposase-like protein